MAASTVTTTVNIRHLGKAQQSKGKTGKNKSNSTTNERNPKSRTKLDYSEDSTNEEEDFGSDGGGKRMATRGSPCNKQTGKGRKQSIASPSPNKPNRHRTRSPASEGTKRKKTGNSPVGSPSKKKRVSQDDTDVTSNVAMDNRVSTFVGREGDGREGAKVTIDDYRKYLRHILQRKTLVENKLKNLDRLKGTEVKVEKLAVLEQEMMAATRKIVAKWHRKGKWVFYPTTKVCKTQRKSMDAAGVTHTSEFAKDITRDFMTYDWPDMENWDIAKLWNGGLKVFQLGKQALMALKDARNMCTQRVVATVDQFLVVPLDNKNVIETKKIKLRALRKFAMVGPKDEEALKTCLPLLAAFCLQKEKESTSSYRAASNWTIGKKDESYEAMFSPLAGSTLQEKMTARKMAFLQTVIHNNLIGGTIDKKDGDTTIQNLTWKPQPADLRYTSPKVRAVSGGWSQHGLDFFIKMTKEDLETRLAWKVKYTEKEQRPDFFPYRHVSDSDTVDDRHMLEGETAAPPLCFEMKFEEVLEDDTYEDGDSEDEAGRKRTAV